MFFDEITYIIRMNDLFKFYIEHADDVLFGSVTLSDSLVVVPVAVFLVVGFVYCVVKKIEFF